MITNKDLQDIIARNNNLRFQGKDILGYYCAHVKRHDKTKIEQQGAKTPDAYLEVRE